MSPQQLKTDRPPSPAIVALVCALLLLGQTLFALHQIEHLSHPHDGVCELCVIGNGIGSPLPVLTPQLVTVTASVTPPAYWLDTACRDQRGYHRYFPRAPPHHCS
ncbi:hypothetical protein [Thiospirillum jenense]|uniref:DUF2607 family protein n=1 Tax=Thiospirillum jenense TaxID=1653858 RepID=A0A839HE25_9GAMM|nr:hypothetical protein [Thiospirillum jenense]MBB1125636.1 hypothetical protein [Thiospirillum jenense]